jgi:hypothetical protein
MPVFIAVRGDTHRGSGFIGEVAKLVIKDSMFLFLWFFLPVIDKHQLALKL